MDTVAQDLLELNKFNFLDYYYNKCKLQNIAYEDFPSDESKWMLNFIDDSEIKYHKMMKLYSYQTWLYCLRIIKYDYYSILNGTKVDSFTIVCKGDPKEDIDSINIFLNKLEKQNIIIIMQDKLRKLNEYIQEREASEYVERQNEMKFIDYTYIAIVYLSFIKQMIRAVDNYDTTKYVTFTCDTPKYDISNIVVFKKDIIDNAFDIIKKSLDHVLINDLNKIIIDYIASGSNIMYI